MSVGAPGAQTPCPLAGGLAPESGTTVTQNEAAPPAAAAVTGMGGIRPSGVPVGVTEIACCSWEPLVTRP